ncbi:MAG: hypothetical protein IPP66_11745 [Anaerolineales bacterium]|nr:hypothetical protein [Anaerolineales bacterium]
MIALVVFLIAVLLLLAFTFMRRKSPAVFRKIEAYERLKRVVGQAVEDGTRLHISIGRGNLFTPRGGSALAGLAMLRRLSERTSLSDHPPIVSSGDASLAVLSQDTLQAGYHAAGAEDQYRFTTGRLTGLTPFAFAAGTIPIIRDENVSANVVIGDFGPEVALLAEAADREDTDLIAASDNPSAQAVLYVSSQEPLIGEELFAAGAYLGAGASHDASLQTQDVLRWLVILAIFGGVLLKLAGINF